MPVGLRLMCRVLIRVRLAIMILIGLVKENYE